MSEIVKVKFTVDCAQYGNNCLSSKNGYKWRELFRNSSKCLKDEHQPGRTVKAATPNRDKHAIELTQENQHITLEEMCAELNISHRTA
jgi:predicted HTH transcriptional regulator